MGFFSKPDEAPHSTNTPLTKERIAAFLTSQEWFFSEDADGDLGGAWDDNVFYFFVMGKSDEVLQVRGRGDAFYRSSLVARSPLLERQPREFDPLARLLARAHARRLQVHAWTNVLLTAHFGQGGTTYTEGV